MEKLYQETRTIMAKYNITANKNLGQNFLIEEKIIEEILKASSITQKDLIIEVGPGLGNLTKKLLEKAGKVVCIELDKRMVNLLQDRFQEKDNLEIKQEDILKVDLQKVIQESGYTSVKIVANLPYYITTPIIMKLLEDKLNIQSIIVMVQKEVAQRLTAETGTEKSGAITYGIRYYTYPEIITEVDKSSFIPIPEVDSAVIRLTLLTEPSVTVREEKLLFQIIKLAFMQRRKTLVNALSNGKLLEKQQIETMLKELGIDSKIRGEKLTLEQFAKLEEYMVEKYS